MKYSKDRKLIVNIILFIVVILGLFIIPSLKYLLIKNIIKNEYVCEVISNLIYILFLYLIYRKDINLEVKTYKNNFRECIKTGLKYYFLGLGIMIISNLIINLTIGKISCNENTVRDMLFSHTLYTMISIMIIAPLSEEIIFRKSIQPIFKNKWVYTIVCGFLFGVAHIISCKITLLSLVYIIPYGALGCAFALMNYKSKTVFTSITMHFLHNTITGILLLLVSYYGVI